MRLYIKFFAIVLAAASLQHFVLSDAPPSELWFGFRCSFAYMINDKTMVDRLADEARDVEYWTQVRRNAGG